MNRSRLLMIGVLALTLGLFSAVYVYKNIQGKSSGGKEQQIDVMVAANDLQVGARVEEHDIRIINIGVADLPPGAPRRKSEVIGRGVILPISKGEFILPTKLAGENAGAGLQALIPPGMRALSVRVNEVVSVAGFVTPGTRVDVLHTGTPAGASEEQTTTVLQNVAVLAAGHALERTSTGEAQNAAVITLLVSPDDAERLTLASTEGHIQLALRNPLDTHAGDVAPAGARGLYKGLSAPAPPVKVPVHHAMIAKTITPPPPTPTGISVEVYEGEKMKNVNCSENSCDDK